MLDPKNLPTKVEQLRAEVLKENKAGTAIPKAETLSDDKTEILKESGPGQSPPHSPNEGIGSASSKADQGAGAKEEASKAPTANGKATVHKPKGKENSAPKRRRTTSAGPTLSRQDEIPRPAAITLSQGWTDTNKALFEEWGQYYIKLVHTSDILTEDDVATLREIEKRQIDEHHTSLEKQKALLEDFKKTPMPRPEGAPKECYRHNPIEKIAEAR